MPLSVRCARGWESYVTGTAAYEAAVAAEVTFATVLVFLAAALRMAAHRFRAASPILLRAAALNLRFAFAGSALAFLTAAHLFRCAAAMRLRAAALNLCFFGVGDGEVAKPFPSLV
jgi:hypothetical protein